MSVDTSARAEEQHDDAAVGEPRPPTRRRARVGNRAFTRVLFAVDALALSAATALTVVLFPSGDFSQRVLLALPLLGVAALAAAGGYRPKLRRRLLDEVEPTLGAIALAAMLIVAVILVIDVDARPGRTVGPAWALASVLVLVARGSAIVVKRAARRRHVRAQCADRWLRPYRRAHRSPTRRAT